MLPFSQFCLAMKVAAAGPVSQEDAAAALQRYKKLEDAAPTVKQVGRYAGIGAVAAPVATVLKDTISGGKPILGGSGNRLRTLAGNAVAGALTSGGIPLVRAHLDREAEKNTLRKYIAQSAPPKVASVPAATGLRRVGQVFSGSRVKALTEDSAAAVRKGSDAFKESERKGTRANELIRWAEEMEPLTMEPQRHARANARLYREEAQRHAAEGAEHVARGAALKREAKGERLKQVGAIGGTAAAAATGAAIGAKKLLSRKDTEKEKTSAMSGVTPAKPWAANEYADMGKMGAGAPTRGGFLMASEVAPWRQPKLHTAIQHEPQQIVEKMGAARAEWLRKYVAQGVAPKIASVPTAKGLARVKEVFTGSRAKKLRDQAGVATARADQHLKDSGHGHARFISHHLASEVKHRDAATHLNIEANVERAKQVGAIGGTAAAATGAAIGTKKLLGKKDAEKEKTSAMSGVTPARPWAAGEYADMGKMGAGASTRGGFLMASEVAPWRQPKLHTAIQHEPQQIVEKMGAARAEWLQKRAGATTPAGRLASSHRVGLPKVSAPPGPSIADTVPTFGQRLPGANKTTIGKRSIRETPTLANTAPPQG